MSLHGDGDMHYPTANYYAAGAAITPDSNVNLIGQGTDPKPLILDYCKP